MKITKQHLGKRLLVKKRVAYFTDPCEVVVLEVSPSGHYVKMQFVRADDTTYTDWVMTENYDLTEVLACKAGDLLYVLNELADSLRSHLRYSTDPDWDTATVEKLYEILNRMKTEHCIHFD